ncbi:MAG: ATP-binding protein, partial [Lautropia sp.]
MNLQFHSSSFRVLLVSAPFEVVSPLPAVDAIVVHGADAPLHLRAVVAAAGGVPVVLVADADARVSAAWIAEGADDVVPAGAAAPTIDAAVRRAVARHGRAPGAARQDGASPQESAAAGPEAPHAAPQPMPQAVPQVTALTRLAGGVAHDFNNLLLVIAGQTDRLRELMPADPAFRGPLDAIAGAASRAGTVTQQLLAISRRQMLVPDTLELNAVVLEAVPALASRLGAAVQIVTHLAHGLPAVQADRAQLVEALSSLTAHAGESMPDGGLLTLATDLVSVSGSMRRQRPWLPTGEFIRLRITDTGSGIEQSVLPHVFEPFSDVDDPIRPRGLGLASVYSTIKQSGGYIWIDSAPGRGTEVTLLLPRAVDPAAAGTRSARAPETVARAAERAANAPGPRVLLVEDEQEVRQLLAAMLERQGMMVAAVESAEAGLVEAEQHRFDILISDVVLPGRSGPELAREVRQ